MPSPYCLQYNPAWLKGLMQIFILALYMTASLPTYKTSLLQTKAYRLLREYIVAIFKEYDLTVTQWSVLGNLYESTQMRLADIAELLGVEAPHITNMIDILIQKGLVERKENIDDKREKLITLTPKAQELIPHIEQEAYKKLHDLFQGISEETVNTYFSVLTYLITKLSASA